MFNRKLIPALLAATALATSAAMATEDARVEVGTLTCDVSEGSGFVIGSERDMVCTFNPTQSGVDNETYTGNIKRWGLDLGKTSSGEMGWIVLAPTEAEIGEDSLEGTYAGVSAEATVGVGVGANLLVGGSDDTLALQPLSVSTQEGLNIAAGVAELNLRHTGS